MTVRIKAEQQSSKKCAENKLASSKSTGYKKRCDIMRTHILQKFCLAIFTVSIMNLFQPPVLAVWLFSYILEQCTSYPVNWKENWNSSNHKGLNEYTAIDFYFVYMKQICF